MLIRVGALVAALYWLTTLASRESAAWFEAAVASAHHAPLVVGVPLDVTPLGLQLSEPTLLVSVADDCDVCRSQIPLWVTLWKRSEALGGIDVIVLSRTGHMLADQIARAVETSVRQVRIRTPANTPNLRYLLAGIRLSGTPMILLLNRDRTVAAVVGPPSRPGLTALEKIIGDIDR